LKITCSSFHSATAASARAAPIAQRALQAALGFKRIVIGLEVLVQEPQNLIAFVAI
jgi:hypothetical protein